MKRWQELEKAVADLLDLYKIKYWQVKNYRCFKKCSCGKTCGQILNAKAKGMPDFVCYSPLTLYIEVKTGKGKLTKEQKEIERLTGNEFLEVRDNIDDLKKFFDHYL